MTPQETTFSSGAVLRRGENDRELIVPAPKNWTLWLALLVVPVFVGIGWNEWRATSDTIDRAFYGVMLALVVAFTVRTIDVLTRRTRFYLNSEVVGHESTGLLGTRSHRCPRGEFRYGSHHQPRRGIPYVQVFFGPTRASVCLGWYERDITGVLLELEEWAQMGAGSASQASDAVLVNSRLSISVEGDDRSVEIPPPRRNPLLWAAIPALLFFGGAFIYLGTTDPRRDALVLVIAVPILILVVVVTVVDLLTTRTRISVTPGYVALASRGWFSRKSFTCARTDFTILGYVRDRRSPLPGLGLQFGDTRATVLRGGDSRDIAETIAVLESWLITA